MQKEINWNQKIKCSKFFFNLSHWKFKLPFYFSEAPLSLFGPRFLVSIFSTTSRIFYRNSIVIMQRNMALLLLLFVHLTPTRGLSPSPSNNTVQVFSSKSNFPSFTEIHVSLLLKHKISHFVNEIFPQNAWLKHFNNSAIFLILFCISTTSYHFYLQ